jgi:flagellar assembly factor FliW
MIFSVVLDKTSVERRVSVIRHEVEEIKMVIETKDLGNVEIKEKDIIHFPQGLYGFENARNFVLLLGNGGDNPFLWLQCTDNREPRFVVIDPFLVLKDYNVSAASVAPLISLKDEKNMRLLVIATVTAGAKEVYVNLKCPIVLNAQDNIAMQIILDNDDYPIKYYLYAREG